MRDAVFSVLPPPFSHHPPWEVLSAEGEEEGGEEREEESEGEREGREGRGVERREGGREGGKGREGEAEGIVIRPVLVVGEDGTPSLLPSLPPSLSAYILLLPHHIHPPPSLELPSFLPPHFPPSLPPVQASTVRAGCRRGS